MRPACPTPVTMVEEDTGKLRTGRGLQPPLAQTRTRVSKGFTCRRASVHEMTNRQGTLSPSTDLRGTTIFKKRTHRELVSFIAAPRNPTCTHRLGETSRSMAREYIYPYLLRQGTLLEGEGERGEGHENFHRLNVTGRNPVLSDSNDWRRPLPIEFPTKAVSTEHQFQPIPPPLGKSRKTLPIRSLNVGGLGLPYRAEQQQAKGKDYKPGRIVNTSFDCFRCENRMSAHDDHQWFESILTASRGRGIKRMDTAKEMKRPVGRKYSKDEISRALFPRYWSKECLSPDLKPQGRTPDTRPVTQTPDTISGPWRVGNTRSDSMEGMTFTRENLKGFCGGHARTKCKPGSKHGARLAPLKHFYSDTHIGLNITTCGDIWCHDADVCTDSCSPGRMEHEKSDFLSRNVSRISHSGKTSRLSNQSRDGHQTLSSGFEFMMRFHCDTSDDVFYELHEEESNHCTDPAGLATVKVACSLTSNEIRRLDGSRCADAQGQDEEHFVDNGEKSCSVTNTSPSCCYSQTSDSQDVLESRCSPARRPSHLKSYSVLSANLSYSRSSTRSVSNADVRPSNFKSQLNCNTSAVDQFPKFEVKGKKVATVINAKDVRGSLYRDLKEQHLANEDLVESPRCNGHLEVDAVSVPTETACEDEDQKYESYELNRRRIDLQFDDEEDENEAEEEQQLFEEEHDAKLFSKICEGQLTRNKYDQTYPDLPKPIGRYFCYVPIVDKRYNRWKRRKPKKRKRAQMKIRQQTMKTLSSASDESAVLDGRESKRSKRSKKHSQKSKGKKSRQISSNESRGPTPREHQQDKEQDLSDFLTEPEYQPVFDQSNLADDAQFPNSTEANTNTSKSSLTSSGSRSSNNLLKLESYVSSSPITLIDIQDQECSSEPSGYEVQNTPEDNFMPELIVANTRARSRVASIPSKKCPRTQKSLLSLSLRGPSVEKEFQTTDPMKALPRTGGRLPLIGTQRSILARSSENMLSCVPGDTSYVSGVERRLGWIKRGILQKTSNQSITSLPRTDLKLDAEKYTITESRKTCNSRTGSTKGNAKSRSGIPRNTKASTAEKFAPIVRGKKKIGSSKKKRHETRKSDVQDTMTVYMADEEDEDCDDSPTFTLKDLLSTLPDSDSSAHSLKKVDRRTRKRNKSPTNLTNIFKNFVKGRNRRKTPQPEVGRSVSALSMMPVFTFSVYTLPDVYRSHRSSK